MLIAIIIMALQALEEVVVDSSAQQILYEAGTINGVEVNGSNFQQRKSASSLVLLTASRNNKALNSEQARTLSRYNRHLCCPLS